MSPKLRESRPMCLQIRANELGNGWFRALLFINSSSKSPIPSLRQPHTSYFQRRALIRSLSILSQVASTISKLEPRNARNSPVGEANDPHNQIQKGWNPGSPPPVSYTHTWSPILVFSVIRTTRLVYNHTCLDNKPTDVH